MRSNKWKLMPYRATDEMLKAMDECSTEGYDERLYAGHASSVYSAAWDAFQSDQVEPVVWMYQDKSTHEVRFQKHMAGFVDHGQTYETPLYTQPQEPVIDKSAAIRIATALGWTPPRQPLTDEEIFVIWEQAMVKDNGKHARLDNQPFVHFARAIEAAKAQREWVEIDGDDWIRALEMADFDTPAAFEFFEAKLKELNR